MRSNDGDGAAPGRNLSKGAPSNLRGRGEASVAAIPPEDALFSTRNQRNATWLNGR